MSSKPSAKPQPTAALGFLAGLVVVCTPTLAWAASRPSSALGPSPVLTVLMLAGVGLAAMAFLMVSSFVKIAVVLAILRSALGMAQIPPATVVTGLALVLSIYVMAPVGAAMGTKLQPAFEEISQTSQSNAKPDIGKILDSAAQAAEPLRAFLSKQAHPAEKAMFARLAQRRMQSRSAADPNGFLVLVPAFVVSELAEAFQIGFLLFLPFLIIDLVVSNVLMALGMHMLSPATVSLPFKLLLFVMADGWHLLTRGLVTSYM